MSHDLISSAYLREQKILHARGDYGKRGDKWALTVRAIADDLGASSILDYGCGQGSLGRALQHCEYDVREYDPAIAGKGDPPRLADLVVCTDVLEHIEPDKISAILLHLRSLACMALFAVVSLRPAEKTLSDGRNAHILLRDAAWWAEQFKAAGFTIRAQDEHRRECVFELQ